MRITVGVATSGRPETLKTMLHHLGSQLRAPDSVFVCVNKAADADGAEPTFPGVKVLLSAPGASTQRNAIIRAAIDSDVIVFFDDDFFPQADYLLAVERHMQACSGTVVLSGKVLADGIIGPGLTLSECMDILRRDREGRRDTSALSSVTRRFSGYGCNMAVRVSALRQGNVFFDENLPLYSWQEDVDLSRRLAVFGDVVEVSGARGVHMGVKSGRGSGVRLGYSQVANPLYLAGKRSGYPWSWAIRHVAKNVAKNLLRSLRPEPYVDRRGRLRGNMMAFRELFVGRMSPTRILDLEQRGDLSRP
jgi:GT2 family glycosyltransferase